MSKGDSAMCYYESARTELIKRIQLRDTVLLIMLSAIGTIFSVAFGTSAKTEILFIIPYLSFGAASIVSQHQEVIGSLGLFVAVEFEEFMKNINEDAPQWDTSKALKEYLGQAIWMRTVGHFALLIIPPISSLCILWKHGFYSPFPEGLLWWLGLFFTVFSIIVIFKSHNWRIKDKIHIFGSRVDSNSKCTKATKR